MIFFKQVPPDDSSHYGNLRKSARACAQPFQSCLTLCNPMDCIPPSRSMGFSTQQYWSELAFPSPGDLPKPGMKPTSPVSLKKE